MKHSGVPMIVLAVARGGYMHCTASGLGLVVTARAALVLASNRHVFCRARAHSHAYTAGVRARRYNCCVARHPCYPHEPRTGSPICRIAALFNDET